MNAPSIWIAVPTYWTYAKAAAGPEVTIFDHPSPLDTDGTLARTLECFRHLRGDFQVLIVAGVCHPDLADEVHDRVSSILDPFSRDLPIYLVSPKGLDLLNHCLTEPILRLDSYGNIRNVQLAVPYAMGADVVVGIDDDELIEDEYFLDKVVDSIGGQCEGDFVGGMAGPYYDRNGQFEIAGAHDLASLKNIFLKKNYFMNEALKQVMESAPSGGIVKSNVAFGGNMCMARRTIAQVCHDPYIPRGEDYDYVINAKMQGINFYFRPDMRIVHLPPDSTGSQAADKMSKLIADIKRFIYMKEKIRYHSLHYPQQKVDIGYLLPYPGVYLDEDIDLEREGVQAIDQLYPEYRSQGSPEDLVTSAAQVGRVKAEEFFAYRDKWQTLTRDVEANQATQQVISTFRIST